MLICGRLGSHCRTPGKKSQSPVPGQRWCDRGREGRGGIFQKQIDKTLRVYREEEVGVKQESIISSVGNMILWKELGNPKRKSIIWAGRQFQFGDVTFAGTGEECHLNAEQPAEGVRLRDLLLAVIKHWTIQEPWIRGDTSRENLGFVSICGSPQRGHHCKGLRLWKTKSNSSHGHGKVWDRSDFYTNVCL